MSDDFNVAVALAAGSPLGAVGAFAAEVIGDIFAAAPLPDARPMPFSTAGCQVIADDEWNISSDLGRRKPASVGPGGALAHPEYAEAFARLDALGELGRPILGDELVRLSRAAIARELNAGVYVAPDGGFYCVQRERPSVGRVRGMLRTYAAKIGESSDGEQLGALSALVAQAAAPLTDTMPRRASVPWLSMLLVAGFGLALWGAFR